MNTYEMIQVADKNGERYCTDDMYYKKGKGFHDYNFNEWKVGSYEGMGGFDAFIHEDGWEMVESVKKGCNVKIINGSFRSVIGIVFDIDDVATERELVILVPKSLNNDELYLYIDMSDVEIISTKD